MNENNIFTCDACRYTFAAPIRPLSCPDCGKSQINGGPAVRAATSAEIKEYFKIRRELAEEDKLLRAANL